MVQRLTIGTGLILASAALAGSVAFAQSPTSTVSPSPENTGSPSPSQMVSPSPTVTLPSGAPATGGGL